MDEEVDYLDEIMDVIVHEPDTTTMEEEMVEKVEDKSIGKIRKKSVTINDVPTVHRVEARRIDEPDEEVRRNKEKTTEVQKEGIQGDTKRRRRTVSPHYLQWEDSFKTALKKKKDGEEPKDEENKENFPQKESQGSLKKLATPRRPPIRPYERKTETVPIDSQEVRIKAMEEALALKEEQLKKATEDGASLLEKNEQLQGEMKSLKVFCESKQEGTQLADEFVKVQMRNKVLETQLQEAQRMNEMFSRDLEAKEKELIAMRAEHENDELKKQEQEEEIEVLRIEMIQENQSLKNQISALLKREKEQANFNPVLDQSKVQELQGQLGNEKRASLELSKELEIVKSQLQTERNTISEREMALRQLINEKAEIESNIKKLSSDLEQVSFSRNEIESQNRVLQSSLNEMRENFGSTMKSLNKDLDKNKREQRNLQKELEAKTRMEVALRDTIDRLKAKMRQQQEQLFCSTGIREMNSSSLTARETKLIAQLDQAKGKISRMKQQLQNMMVFLDTEDSLESDQI